MAQEWLARQSGTWTPERGKKLATFLTQKVYSSLGDCEVTAITPPQVLTLCRQIESLCSAYMAHVILSLISRIMRYAVASGYAQSDPCRDLKRALKPHKEKHMPAIVDPTQVGLMALRIDGYSGSMTTRSAMQILPLCMCRTIEARGARWRELDLDGNIWRIPAERMKMRREHLIPLSRQAKEIFLIMRNLTGREDISCPILPQAVAVPCFPLIRAAAIAHYCNLASLQSARRSRA